ncbi:nucleolar pre-ribosomal-associated protein 1 isoform X2 [Myripristis murdjan]|uniref:URB1 ribosome biogenesis homolog n=1 Tax=Myripristis murdjan TaxID=586833 RepID=A0A667Y0N4_9TELE|nr:nucleolar pre-ribosomal-associated protein 1 isoform X2 [Myripristis murdjan]
MGKKRQNEESLESKTQAKKETPAEFNGTVFKTMLKEPTKAMKGLETFISTAKKLPCPALYDVVEGYIKISMECAEVFKLLEGEKHVESEMVLIFETLEMILLRTASDLSHFNMVGTAIVKKTISGYMKLLQGSFSSENHRFARQCLNLLSAMVSQGPDSAREVLSHIHLNKSLSGLAKRKDKRGRPDVRMAFVQFALSFLVSGDHATVGQLLEMKEFLPEILSSGLKEDRISIVSLILSTLKTRVVLNKALSKTQKVRFFTPAILAHIASLYKWNGIIDASTDDDKMSENPEQGGVLVVRELVHSFLMDLCCSRKHGITFHDPSFGTAGRAGNIVLLQFLVGLKQATEDQLVSELVVSVLKASPDILSRYFKETQYSYTPRLKSAWQDNVGLLKKIYEAQPEISVIFQTREIIPVPRLLSMIMVTSVPPVCNKAFFTQGLNFANTAVQHTALSMTSFILKRAQKNMEYLLDKSVWLRSDVYSPDMMEDLVQQYRETLSKILPDMTGIVAKWQSLSKKDKTEAEENKEKKENNSEKDAKMEGHVAETAEIILLKALILQVVCLYQKVVPHLVSQCKFDFSKLLKGIMSEKGMRDEVPPVLQYQILQLALDLPASKFSWFRIQDVADSDSTCGEKSVLYLLLKMFVSSRNSHLKTSTQMLVLKVLKDSGAFEYTWAELELWLNHLARLEPSQQETVIQFLERVLGRLVCNSHIYTDKVASLVQEAAYLQANLSNQEADAASIPVSHIDDVLDMLDVIMEGNEGEMEDFGPALTDDLIIQTFPFSAVVPAALEARNKLPADKGVVYEYLSAVLSDVLHCQREPLPLCLALLQYDKELLSSEPSAGPHPSVTHLHHYYSKWLPRQSQEELFKFSEHHSKGSPRPTSFTAIIKAAYCKGPDCLLEETFRTEVDASLAAMAMVEFPVAIRQILLYVKSTVDNFGTFSKDTGTAVLRTLMGILQDVVAKLQGFQDTTTCEPVAESSQEGSDLFLEINQLSTAETNKEQTLIAALSSVFRHPCLEQWFLALELAALPPHSLKPVRLKQLCAQLSDDVLALLKTSTPALRDLGHLELVRHYLEAVEKAVLKELLERGSRPAERQSRPVQALLSVHSYMDSTQLRELVSTLLLLPQESLVSDAAPAELSVYGHAVLQILTECNSGASRDHSLSLSQAHLHGLGTLLLSCSSPALEAFLLQTLSGEPGSAKLIHADVLLHCLQRPRPATQAISALLLQNCSTHRLRFELWCLEPENMEKLSGQAEAFLPLINTYLQMASREDPARPKDVQTKALKAFKQALLAGLCCSVLDGQTSDSTSQRAEALAGLIELSAKLNDIRDVITSLPAALQRADGVGRWQLVDAVSEKLADRPEEQETWRKSVVAAALKWLISSYGRSRDQAASPSAQEESVLLRLQKLLTHAEDVAASEWNGFVKSGLKYRYRDHHFLEALGNLLGRMYGGSDLPKDLLPLSTMHMMISSHSLFLPTMLDPDEEARGSQAKEALISLLLCLVRKCPAVCSAGHFVVLLGAYGATLSASDQKLLLLLQEYERNDVSLLDFQSFLWGPAAVEHHKTRKTLGASLWKHASPEDLLALLNADRMLHTIERFPQRRKIIPPEGQELLYDENDGKDLGNLYDPCFLLPLFSSMLRPECVIDCQKFVSSHAFGVTVMALSSYDSTVRAAGCHVLSSYCQHLEGARFREKRQLLYLMDMVKNGIRQQNQRLPFVLTTYISKVAQQMLKPEEHMYVVINKFLLSHQSLDLRRVPEFFKLFYGFDLEHKMEREWILSVLREGVADQYSYELCNQQGIFHSLLGFGCSPLCDEHSQALIIRVLCQAARGTKAGYNLSKSCGLLTWILQLAERRHVDQILLGAVIDLLHVLWFANLGQREKHVDGTSSSSSKEDKPQSFKCVPLPLVNEFLCVTSSIMRHLRLGVKAAQLSVFLQTLGSVLKHRGTALSVNKQAERFTLHPQALSSTEALTLLQCWASLSHNATLLAQLQSLSEKHKVKELTGTGKDKSRGKGFFPKTRARKEDLAEDAETEKQEQTLLTECKPHLSSIFAHWEPACPLTSPQLAPPRSSQDPGCLAGDTAHLLTKWSLRCLVEGSYDDSRTKAFLQWLDKAVVKHKDIVEVVMHDPGLRADLLRLYHQAAEAQCPATHSARVETLQLFTNIMIKLLETQGQTPHDLGQVLGACQSDATHDQSRSEAGLFLLSLYIHELWSGATSAQLFLSHVSLVNGAKCKGPKSSRSSLTQTAIRAVCNDIVAMKSSI